MAHNTYSSVIMSNSRLHGQQWRLELIGIASDIIQNLFQEICRTFLRWPGKYDVSERFFCQKRKRAKL